MKVARAWMVAVLAVIALSTVLRLPLLRWPFAKHPDAFCCGHPDELTHYDLVAAFRSRSDPGSYPPGLAFLTLTALGSPAGYVASLLTPERAAGDRGDRIRVVSMARVLSLALSGVAVWLLYRICLEAGLAPGLAAASAPLLALAPLYGVQSAYALADVPNVALVLASIYVFLRWHRRRAFHLEVLFGFLLGGALAVKLVGVVIGIPPLISMIARSDARRRTSVAIGLSFLAGAYAFSGGFTAFATLSSIFQKVIVENARTSRIRPLWNAAHHLLSLLPGMGLLFLLLLMASAVTWLVARARAGRVGAPSRVLDPLPALAIGSFLYFLGICFSSNPFTRHMLPVYPFLILFVLVTIAASVGERMTPGRQSRLGALLFAAALAYNTFASWPLLRSFARDPVDEASAWVREKTGYEPRVPVLRNFPPVPSIGPRPGAAAAPEELVIVHSAWVGRLTGSWWLKPAPTDLRDVYHFEGSLDELRSWQELMAGKSRNWRVIASFGDGWKTPERLFLSLLGRGYDQFVTAGRVSVVARAPGRSG